MKFLATLIAILSLTNVFSQKCSGWNWPEDKEKAETKYAIYSDANKRGDFREAANVLQWILKNAPDLNRSNYINGASIYKNLSELEKDPVKKRELQDSALLMYDLRIQFCNDKASVLNRKAFEAYQFFKDDKAEYQNLYELFEEAFDLNGNDTWDNNLVAYMYMAHKYKKAGGDLSDDEILNVYDKIVEIIEYKISLGKNIDRLNNYKDNVDKLLTSTVNVDCEFVEKNLVPKLESNPDDLKMAKKIFGLALFAKCTDSEFFVETAIRVHEKEPNYGMAWTIGNKCLAKQDYKCATRYFKEAITLTEENVKIGDLNYKLATIANANGQKASARDYALKSAQNDPANKDGYNLVANLYMNSYNDCRMGEDKVKDRLVFLAAYDMYLKAGNGEGMANAKEQFPSVEELFERNYTKGQSMTIGCWINQTVALQTRD